MHISEGVLSGPVLAAGAALALAGTALGLKTIPHERLMTVALTSAAFFVATLIHVPVGPAQAHLVLNGLLGAVLGWAAFPAILVGLGLQTLLFQYGGFTALGVNTFDMALPAVVCGLAARPFFASPSTRFIAGFCCGLCSVLLAAILTAAALALSDEAFFTAAWALAGAHLPVMVVEGLVTGVAVSFLARVRPEILALGPNPKQVSRT